MPSLQVVLLVVLLGSLSSAHATDWGFTLIGSPSVERNDDEEFHEMLHMTGAGTFNPDQGTASGGGSFTTLNAFDDAVHALKERKLIDDTRDGSLVALSNGFDTD